MRSPSSFAPSQGSPAARVLAALALLAALAARAVPEEARAAEQAPRAIRVGCERDFRPYAFVDERGRPAGFGVELIGAVADAMGLEITVTPGTWDESWSGLLAGRIDALPVVARLPSRVPLVDFSLPHTETFDAFFVRRGEPALKDLGAARGKEIVVLRSDAAHHALLERRFEGELVPVDTTAEMFRLVASGRHDAVLYPKVIGALEIKRLGLSGALAAGPPIPDYKRVFSFAVRKGDADLLEKLNQGLLIVKTGDEYDRIYQKWLAADDPWRRHRKYLAPAAAAAAVLVLLAGAWVVMLQLLVRRRTRELVEKNALLRLAGEDLEARVAQRTAELSQANAALQTEIAERARAEEAVRALNADLSRRNAELESVNRELESFTYSVSHDLRTPLRAVSAFSQLLLRDGGVRPDGRSQDRLARIVGAAARMNEIIEDLLALSTVSRKEVHWERVDLSALARSILEELREAEPARQVDASVAAGVTAEADPHLIRLALANLLGNAWKFTARTAGARIEFDSLAEGGRRVYVVRDNGAGFNPAWADKLFLPFHRLHASEDFAGTGIGLAIVERVISRLGGTVWAEGQPDRGATFFFTLREDAKAA